MQLYRRRSYNGSSKHWNPNMRAIDQETAKTMMSAFWLTLFPFATHQ
jgi:hypothetical protein